MRTVITARSAAAGLAAAALAVTAIQAASPASAAPAGATARAISCSTATNPGKQFYAGPSASKVYDARFSNGPSVPHLSTRTPQGVGTWSNWDGKGHTLLLVTAYKDKAQSYVYGIDPVSGISRQTVVIAETHAGGVAVSGSWIYISGSGTSIRKYRTSTMRAAMNSTREFLYVKSVGSARKVYGASFLSSSGGYLFAGRFNSSGRDKMYAYKVHGDGSLTTGSSYQVPTKTQGVAVTSNRFVFSTSYGRHNRGNIYVVERGYSSLDAASLRCFRSPSMNEGATIVGSRIYVVYESGSYEYRKSARNPITRLHKAALSSLTDLV